MDRGPGEGVQRLRHNQGVEGFLAGGVQAVDELLATTTAKLVVVDVGAGFFDAKDFPVWLRRHVTVAFTAPSVVAYQRMKARNPSDLRTHEGYKDMEYNPYRMGIYQSSSHQILADCGADELGQALVKLAPRIDS